MALTKEKNMVIAAMNAKGMCIEAIARKAGVSKDDVRDSLESRGRSYIEIGIMTKEEKEGWIRELHSGGKSIAEIMELTGLGKATVYTYIFYKGKDEAKKAEKPAAKAEPKEGRSYNTHTVKDKETVIRLYKEGRMQKDIAKETGVSKSTVCKWIADFKKEQPGEQPEPKKKTQINEEFDKAVDKMIEESKADTEKQAYEEAAVEVESEPIKTENEKREEAGIEPIIEPEVKQASSEYLAAVKWAEDKGVDPTDKIAFVELLYKEFRDMYRDYNEAKNERAHANMALSKMMEEVADLTRECKKLEAEKEQFINSPCECDNNRILKVCEMELKAAENVFMRIYGKLSDAERQAWDLGEIYANLMRARGEFI